MFFQNSKLPISDVCETTMETTNDIIHLRTPSSRSYPILGSSLVYEYTIGTTTEEFLDDQITILALEVQAILQLLNETPSLDSTDRLFNYEAYNDISKFCNQAGVDRENQILNSIITRNKLLGTQIIAFDHHIVPTKLPSTQIITHSPNQPGTQFENRNHIKLQNQITNLLSKSHQSQQSPDPYYVSILRRIQQLNAMVMKHWIYFLLQDHTNHAKISYVHECHLNRKIAVGNHFPVCRTIMEYKSKPPELCHIGNCIMCTTFIECNLNPLTSIHNRQRRHQLVEEFYTRSIFESLQSSHFQNYTLTNLIDELNPCDTFFVCKTPEFKSKPPERLVHHDYQQRFANFNICHLAIKIDTTGFQILLLVVFLTIEQLYNIKHVPPDYMVNKTSQSNGTYGYYQSPTTQEVIYTLLVTNQRPSGFSVNMISASATIVNINLYPSNKGLNDQLAPTKTRERNYHTCELNGKIHLLHRPSTLQFQIQNYLTIIVPLINGLSSGLQLWDSHFNGGLFSGFYE